MISLGVTLFSTCEDDHDTIQFPNQFEDLNPFYTIPDKDLSNIENELEEIVNSWSAAQLDAFYAEISKVGKYDVKPIAKIMNTSEIRVARYILLLETLKAEVPSSELAVEHEEAMEIPDEEVEEEVQKANTELESDLETLPRHRSSDDWVDFILPSLKPSLQKLLGDLLKHAEVAVHQRGGKKITDTDIRCIRRLWNIRTSDEIIRKQAKHSTGDGSIVEVFSNHVKEDFPDGHIYFLEEGEKIKDYLNWKYLNKYANPTISKESNSLQSTKENATVKKEKKPNLKRKRSMGQSDPVDGPPLKKKKK